MLQIIIIIIITVNHTHMLFKNQQLLGFFFPTISFPVLKSNSSSCYKSLSPLLLVDIQANPQQDKGASQLSMIDKRELKGIRLVQSPLTTLLHLRLGPRWCIICYPSPPTQWLLFCSVSPPRTPPPRSTRLTTHPLVYSIHVVLLRELANKSIIFFPPHKWPPNALQY